MKKSRLLFLLIIPLWVLIFAALLLPAPEDAPIPADSTVFGTLTAYEDQAGFLARTSFVRYDKEYAGLPVECFDAAADGRIALGFKTRDGLRYAAVLDAEGRFQYGFSFACTGAFQLDWREEGLGVYWVRSGVLGVFDGTGSCLAMYEADTGRESSRHITALGKAARLLPDGSVLRLRNPEGLLSRFCSGYQQLVRIAPDGTEHILYDAPGGTLPVFAILLILIAALGSIVLYKRRS